jgi:DNA-binding MarR family transcriptional regulator
MFCFVAPFKRHTCTMTNKHGRLTDFGGLNHEQMQTLLGYSLAQASVTTTIVYERNLGGPLELRQVDFTILTLIGSNPDVTLKSLAESLGIAPSNLTVIVERGVARKLIVREPSEDDRRSRYLRLTPSGRALLKKAWQVAQHMESAMLEQFSPGERAMLFELLGRVALFRLGGAQRGPNPGKAAHT